MLVASLLSSAYVLQGAGSALLASSVRASSVSMATQDELKKQVRDAHVHPLAAYCLPATKGNPAE